MKDESVMSARSFLNFAWENTQKHFSKLFLLQAIAFLLVALGVVAFVFISPLISKEFEIAGPILGILLYYVLSTMIYYGFFKNILNLCKGKKMDLMAFFRFENPAIGLVLILISIPIIIGYGFFLIPGIILTSFLVFAPILAIDKDLGPIDAISESIKLGKGHRFDLFIGFFISQIILYIIGLFVITLIFVVPMGALVFIYPYLYLTGQLDEAKKNLEASVKK